MGLAWMWGNFDCSGKLKVDKKTNIARHTIGIRVEISKSLNVIGKPTLNVRVDKSHNLLS